jgi:hypothetical protein
VYFGSTDARCWAAHKFGKNQSPLARALSNLKCESNRDLQLRRALGADRGCRSFPQTISGPEYS